MKKYEIPINDDVVSYLERCMYEYDTMKDNAAFLIENSGQNPAVLESPAFQAYEKRQVEAKIVYENAKKELEERYVPDELKSHQIIWSLDFRTKKLIITQMCSCEVSI